MGHTAKLGWSALLLFGLAESFGGFYFSTDYKDIIAFVLLVVILSLRPQGLFTPKGARA